MLLGITGINNITSSSQLYCVIYLSLLPHHKNIFIYQEDFLPLLLKSTLKQSLNESTLKDYNEENPIIVMEEDRENANLGLAIHSERERGNAA